jgi:hypothetical protein
MHCETPEESHPKLGRMYLPIPRFLGYFVGSDGSVWSSWTNENPSRQLAAWHRIKKRITGGRYRANVADKDKKPVRLLVGWLVLMAFKGPPADKTARFVWHINDDLLDDRLSNLRWSRSPQRAEG